MSTDPVRPSAIQRWLAELKRRRVLRVVAVYGAVSFVVLEAADVIFPAIPLPEWSISLVLWMIVLGFPVAIVLAWAFELTPDGVRRTEAAASDEISAIVASPARSRWTAGLLAIGGLVLLGLGFYGGRQSIADGEGSTPEEVAMGAETGSAAVETTGFVDPNVDPRPAIAVLPFADMSPDGDQEYFSDGISEEILTALTRVRELRIASRSSAFAYKSRDVDLTEVGQALNVPYVLAGSVRKDGEQLRITAELVNTDDGFRMWAETYDRRLESVFAIQTEIAEAIASALRVPLGLNGGELVLPTLDMEAHDLYLAARAALRRRGPGVGEAVTLLREAIARDSTWAPAWAALAQAHAAQPLYTGLGRESTDSIFWATNLEAAAVAAERALEIDPRSSAARVALGSVHRDRWEWRDAERELILALELDPDNAEAHIQYAEVLWGMGRLDESLVQTGRALALDRTPLTLDVHAFVLYMNSRPEESEALLEEGIAVDSAGDMHYLRTVLANQMLLDGRYREALDRFAFYLADSTAYRRLGEALERRDASHLPEARPRGWPQVAMLLGEPELALDALEDLIFALPFRVQYDIWDPHLEPIWDTPRFQDVILRRVRLEGRRAHTLDRP